MRIWHESLIPKLCRQHLLSCWREGLGAYSIIVNNKNGYRNHPAVKEFEKNPFALWIRLSGIRIEMLKRGYKPKDLPEAPSGEYPVVAEPWQTLEEQRQVLKSKNCNCEI